MNTGPVFIIDDDAEELDIVQEIWQELSFKNTLEVFTDCERFLKRMEEKDINPFLIISDVNLAKMDGFALRQKLCESIELSYKSIPFIFWSTVASNEQVKHAYDSGGHGFFFKGSTYAEIKKSLNLIMSYWSESVVPELPKHLSSK